MFQMRDLMTPAPVTLGTGSTAAEALALCNEHEIRHVIVLEGGDGGKLAGILSDRDLRDASPAIGADTDQKTALEKLTVREIMTPDPITVHPQDLVGFAAQEMYERKIDALPVISEDGDEEELIGIVTSTDVMRALVTLTGVHEPGTQVQVTAPDRAGIIAEVADEIRALDADIVSVLSRPEKKFENRTMIFRLAVEDPSTVVQSLEMAGYSASWLTIPRRPRR
ncbi:CBS and ACT domain-containing protein [Rubrobacter aplysinae]|uniref:CBS and ACT domain-containing protein n=1 Tax=Rubrobacter aplysinae TaxID=909625 RepID=UPI00064BA9F5|nr:CBS and ACT domain-containing protein [Rubrobacter aplysinae]